MRRDSWRIPVNIDVDIYCENSVNSGKVMNLSEGGMFIIVEGGRVTEYPQYEIGVPVDGKQVRVSGKFVRSVQMENGNQGIGIALVNPPGDYLDFVDSLLLVM